MKNSEITTRRDQDGLALVKIAYKPQYKYNLDQILATDPEENKRIYEETQEALMKHYGAAENPRSILDSINGQVDEKDVIDVNKKELMKKLF